MTKETAIACIESLSRGLTRRSASEKGRAPLDNPGRTRTLLGFLGNPEKKLRVIHVCGSNGKGSVCAMLESILRSAGYRTGMFTSPHLQDFCERIRVDGDMISGEKLAALTEKLLPAAEAMPDKPGLFCFLTALALDYFAEEKCDYVILETGIGGRHDSTNVIGSPELVIVTNIGLEHTEILGDTISKIARDKAGIIKPGCSVAAYDSSPEALREIRKACVNCQVPLQVADFLAASGYNLALPGKYQTRNASLVLTAVTMLRGRGVSIPEDAVRDGLAHVRWPARFEAVRDNPPLIIDGGHNPQCARALTETLESLYTGQPVIFVIGMMKNKNYEETVRILMEIPGKFYCCEPPDERALNACELKDCITRAGGEALSFGQTADALSAALNASDGNPVIVFGSLYLAGQVRDLLELKP